MIFKLRRFKVLSLICMLLLGTLLLTGCGQSDSPSKPEAGDTQGSGEKQAAEQKSEGPDFPTKDITFIVPTSPGGGFDTFSRILAPALQKHLPNNPNIIVKNVPGANWLTGVSEIARSKPDGYTIGIFNNGNALMQITGADVNLTKHTWIGRLTEQRYVGALSAKSKLKSLDDMKKAGEFSAGIVSLKSSDGIGTLITYTEMGIEPSFVSHKGSSEAVLSGVRGDVDYNQLPLRTILEFVPTNDLIPIIAFAPERLKGLPDVPTIKELGYEGLVDLVKVSYLVGGPPGIPEDVSKVLRDAFAKAIAEPEVIKKIEDTSKSEIVPGDHKAAAETIQKSVDYYTKYKDLILENSK